MLQIRNLTKTYAKGGVKAVDNISFHVEQGEIYGFLGPNGAGKTTTIKMITGLLKQDGGTVRINGFDTLVDPLEAKSKIGYVPDNPQVYEKLKGVEYLNFMADVYRVTKTDRQERMARYLQLFDLEAAAGDLIDSYSHGMKQKIVLTGALLHDPDLFVLDEPMVGLDPKSAFNLKEVMRDMCGLGKTVFFSTHVLEVAERICDRIAIIDKGRIISEGTMEELRAKAGREESLEQIFLEVTGA
ncbi:ABC transporter ATP-binding protein [Anaerotalea alkaliphila]|uniref:ABC transporter ATP-binding protein n=1 Tax=Anaerotalea alkaliphila TaxID=2662126 RepID=A0A7X5KP38_9FIRM|nr:ABC transporter ATP-binding protein [Anaerotalea alkaliphila]NDL67472.1 ABC transporter ATP-binding protein [Anaerotalea alkaliphila]